MAYVPPDGEDAVDGMIRRTGCETEYRALETCIVDNDRNFKACQVVIFTARYLLGHVLFTIYFWNAENDERSSKLYEFTAQLK